MITHESREYSIRDESTGESDTNLSLLNVIHTVPDLNNSELCQIIELENGHAVELDNVTVIRTK